MNARSLRPLAAAILAVLCAAAAGQADPPAFQIVYDTVTEKRMETRYQTVTTMVDLPTPVTAYREEARIRYRTEYEASTKEVQQTIEVPVTETIMVEQKYRVQTPVYCTVNKVVCETIMQPVKETIVKECKSTCYKQVKETCYREVPRTVCRTVCTPVKERQSFAVSKPICETHYRDVCRTVCKDVCGKPTSVQVTERVPVCIKRDAQGAYADAASLTGAAGDAARKGATVVGGGTASLAPGCATYDADGPGRVFVEGATAVREVTANVTRNVQATEIVREPYTITKNVAYEVVNKVPTVIEKLVPTTIQRTVPTTTCRMVTEEKVRKVPTQVTCMKKKVVTRCVPYTVCKQVPCKEMVKVPCSRIEMVKTPVCRQVPVQTPVCVTVKKPRVEQCNACASPACNASQCAPGNCASGACTANCGQPNCNANNCGNTNCGPQVCGPKCACRPHPVRDFFGKICASRLACDPCK